MTFPWSIPCCIRYKSTNYRVLGAEQVREGIFRLFVLPCRGGASQVLEVGEDYYAPIRCDECFDATIDAAGNLVIRPLKADADTVVAADDDPELTRMLAIVLENSE
jgi:hypothetical protein